MRNWWNAQENPVFHNFASPTAATSATFFIYTIFILLYLYIYREAEKMGK